MQQRVLSFVEALDEVLTHAQTLSASHPAESVPLLEAPGRVLADPLFADRDQPPFNRSTRDGYAVRASDSQGVPDGEGVSPGELQVLGSVRAGESWSGRPLQPGECIEIMTGAPLPTGADAVVMLEHARRTRDCLWIDPERIVRTCENVVARGAEALAGDSLLPAGKVLRAAEIAVAANCGHTHLQVYKRPVVAIVATGDELVELDQRPEPWQIRNSNSYALAALVQGEGARADRLPIARDTLGDLHQQIAAAREADLILLSGGVSMGKYDLVEQVLQELGAEFFFTGALIQPGRPVVFGRLPSASAAIATQHPAAGRTADHHGWTYFFGLPGNPISTQVCFHLFVAPLLRSLQGRSDHAPTFVEARLAQPMKGGARVTRFLPAELTGTVDAVTARIVGWQGSGDVAANARGSCYCVLPAEVESFASGEAVRVLLR